MPAGDGRGDVLGRSHSRRVRTRRRRIDRRVRHLPRLRIARRQALLLRHLTQLLDGNPGRHIALLRVQAQLQRANVGRNGPAIGGRHLLGIVRHGAVTVGDDIEIVAQRLGHPLGIVEIAGRPVAALDDHACAVADPRVARAAVGVELLLAALQNRHGRREGERVHFFSVLQAGVVEVRRYRPGRAQRYGPPAGGRTGHLR